MEKEDLSTLLPLTTVPIVDPTEGLGLTFEDSALKQAKGKLSAEALGLKSLSFS